ncbi:MAG: hypothetical protein ACYDGM_07915 [Vulcanimicrobiaceae bacterium]
MIVKNGHSATVRVGNTWPKRVERNGQIAYSNRESLPSGLNIVVTPTVMHDGVTRLALRVSYLEVNGRVNGGFPIVEFRQMRSSLSLKPSQTLVFAQFALGGVQNTTPRLSGIPMFGSFVRNMQATTAQREIVFALRLTYSSKGA